MVETHTPSQLDEEWITSNCASIQSKGAEHWLALLLDILEGNTSHDVVNPYHAINIDPLFAAEHPPAFSKEQWVQMNVRRLSEWGTEQWLRLLLDVLEGDIVTSDEIKLVTPAPNVSSTRSPMRRQKRKKRKK